MPEPERSVRGARETRFAARGRACLFSCLALLAAPFAWAQTVLSEGTNLAVDVSPTDGRIAMDLLGSVWIVPRGGGIAEQVSNGLQAAARPKWSPDGSSILYQTVTALGSRMWLLDVASSRSKPLSDGSDYDQHPSWHPGGERIVFSSARGNSGFDLWEMHVETGLSWRLSDAPGDESEPAWSTSGRDLAYIRRDEDSWRLVVRRHGQPDRDIIVSPTPLAAPAWRPDGSLLTYLRRDPDGRYALQMVILSDPPLPRTLAVDEDFFASPASWIDRLRFLYTADGVIRERGINDWESDKVAFTAEVRLPESAPAPARGTRQLPVLSPSEQRLVIRAARVFDGVNPDYRLNVDVLVEQGRIAAVESRRDWEGATVLDLGDVTLLPGFIDSYAALPPVGSRGLGLVLLSYGVTGIVTEQPADHIAGAWETEQTPGPRLLRAAVLGDAIGDPAEPGAPAADGGDQNLPLALLSLPANGVEDAGTILDQRPRDVPLLAESWRTGVAIGANLMLAGDNLPTSPLGRRYRDVQLATSTSPAALVSGLADAGTPGLDALLQSRQAQAFASLFGSHAAPPRRFPEVPRIARAGTVVAGSKPNGLPPGLALHAELRALEASGLGGAEVLRAAGASAADSLGYGAEFGRVVPGALADLVLVRGDPKARIADAVNIVAVVRNGRFYSLVRLLEDAGVE